MKEAKRIEVAEAYINGLLYEYRVPMTTTEFTMLSFMSNTQLQVATEFKHHLSRIAAILRGEHETGRGLG